ncbi:MAG: M23 family metallopeptidase [Oxalobacteraceae bacterium]|jgi:murein DD-endopeptidase MepM/ murein hydrolase activator NlpD|nr:M23 family metallopeptidase [Oxalobacteraceae bacterium]
MQLMWVSGPTGRVRTISITFKKVVVAALVASLSLVVTGFLLYLVGFKIAVETSPDLARTLGGVTTEAEQQRMEAIYRERLAKMQSMLDATAQDIRQLQQLKNRFMEIATPASLRDRNASKEDGRGGPLLLMPSRRSALDPTQPLSETLDNAMGEFGQFNKTISSMRTDWDKQLQWLQTLPTGVPIGGDFRMTSGFGMRVDPFTHTLARHEGLDFTAMHGTPILAAADGLVTRSGWEDTYGNIVEVTHAEGFMTRYAHISKRLVTEGQRIKRGQHIADVGSTGRSTGPHLHYEVFRHGHVMNPAQVLPTGGG